ncbi:strawberry notch C-terminal domain-containing protein [Sphaerothrix gracilis]|uniref:strawberry notch C-terminal domain-containing protein n=1 Tax=Sphaerothrix gracilis TaxID=3151835 RepID=UPI0031FCAC29
MALSEEQQGQLVSTFQERLLAGDRFESIVQARQVASEVLGERVTSGNALAKATEEAIEQGLVRAGCQIVQQGRSSPVETFEQLVDLYQRQPRLGTRSSTSILRQQYSTPMPIAYLGSQLAGIDSETSVYEPTAGHGALLLETNPEKAMVNELDDNRAADLRRQGYRVTQNDATSYRPEPRSQDVVIANPPFGRRRKEGRAERFTIGAEATPINSSQLDHVIAWRSLEAMKDDGSAVLIIGGEKGSEAHRSDEYNTQQNRGFYKNLYDNYNVTDHFTVEGSLYNRQGAGFPIDVIQIEGRGKSQRRLPAADVPRLYQSYAELKEVLDANVSVLREPTGLGAESADRGRNSLDAAGQLLRGNRPGQSERDRQLSGVQASASRSPNVDDPAVGRGFAGAAGGRLSDDPATADSRPGAGLRDAAPRARDAGELGNGNHRESLAEDDLESGDRPGVSAGAGKGLRSERDGSVSEPGRVANLLRQTGLEKTAIEQEETAMAEPKKEQLSGQVPYKPRSKGQSLETLIPRNLSSAVQTALDNLEGRVGDIDEYAARKLNYPSVESMHEVLAAEQVDGVALAIDNLEHGDGSLVGDQTGVGKGRQMAAMLRYAKETDRTPVFVTRDSGLYADMIRDLDDIGVKDFKPFITNSKETVPLPDGRTLKTSPNSHAAELDRLIQQGGLSPEDEYDGVFTTYSQMQTVQGKNTPRREFLEMIAPQSIIVMDEAHEAGGSAQGQWKKVGQPPNRAEFARDLVDKADGVTFSSATAVKRPDVMDLYGRRSGMRDALGSVEALQGALEKGGIPLQQASTNTLAEDGFYIRRERTYEGVDFGIDTVAVDRDSTDRLGQIMGKILEFDRHKQDALKDLDKSLKADAKKVGKDTSIGKAGASSVNFTALMHNVIDQSLLARKADQMADEAIASLEQGEKPILTVSNTMGSFIENYADENDIAPGDEFTADFSDILTRYLERSRDVLEKDYDGTTTRRPLSDAELGPDAVAAFEAAEALIEETELDFPVSPIDHIKQRVEDAGYSMGEITGRKARLEYDSDGNATYRRRSGRETSKAGKVRATDRFNSGKSDVILLNRSGATGISLHASEKFADQRRRHMIVGQAERNINDFMQTLGRAHRTGQVVPPRITLLMGDTPDEKRPAALLEKKMASLNANTTADKNAGFDTSEIPDFFNRYGDAVAEQILSEYPEINEKLDYPIKVSSEGAGDLESVEEGAIAKVTGRLPLLPIDEQESFYKLLEEEYSSFVEQQKALGNNPLEAEAVDLDARSLAQAEIVPPKDGRSAFSKGVQVEVMDVKSQSRPKTQLEVINEVRGKLDLEPVESVEDHDFEAVDERSQAFSSNLLEQADKAAEKYMEQQRAKIGQRYQDPEKRQAAFDKETKRVEKQKTQLTQFKRYRLGQTVRLATDNGRIFYGAVSDISKRGRSLEAMLYGSDESQNSFGDSNPVAASKWQMSVSIADSNREVPIPLSKLNSDRMGSVDVTAVEKTMTGKEVMPQFDERQSGEREVRQALTGNLLRAAEQYGNKGSIINATKSGGEIEPMLLLPKGYDMERELSETPVELPAPHNVRQFMEITSGEGIVKTADEQMTLKQQEGDYVLQTGKKQKGIILDEGLIEAMGDEFYSISDRMEAKFSADQLEDVVSYIQNGRNERLEAVTHLEQARELVGEKIPEFTWSDSVEDVVEKAGLPPSVDLANLDNFRDRLEAAFQEPEETNSESEALDEPVAGDEIAGDRPAELSPDSVPEPDEAEPESEPNKVEQAEPESLAVDDTAGSQPEPEQPQTETTKTAPEQRDSAELEAKVEEVKAAVEQGTKFNFQIDPGFDAEADELYTSLTTDEEGRENFELFDSDDIRIEGDQVQVEVGYDASGETLEYVWIDVPDFAEQADKTLSQRRRSELELNESTESADADLASLEGKVEEVREAVSQGRGLSFQVDPGFNAEADALDTSVTDGEYELFLPDDIRIEGDRVQVQVGYDVSGEGDSPQDVWVDVPDFAEQADRALQGQEPEFSVSGYRDELEALTESSQQEDAQPMRSPGKTKPVQPEPEAAVPPESEETPRIGGWKQQRGKAEKQVGKFLEEAGLSEAVMADEEFYLKVENEPYIPLNIERHDDQLLLYHTLVENGDAFIDSEMVFNLSDEGSLSLAETAVSGPFGEARNRDRSFAGIFAQNIREQGFAAAARAMQQPDPEAEVVAAPEQTTSETTSQELTEPEPPPGEASELVTEAEAFDYQQTLAQLRSDAQALPEAQRENLMSAIAAVEQEMSQPTGAKAESVEEEVPASEFVQEAIASADELLDEEMAELLDDSEAVTVEELRDWYKSARALGRSEEDLEQITQLGKAVKTGEVNSLHQTAAKQMRSDRAEFDAQAGLGQVVAANARRFVQSALQVGLAHQDQEGTLQADGRIYQVKQKDSLISVTNKRTGGGVVADGNEILKVSDLTEGDRRRWMKLGAKSPQELRGQPPQAPSRNREQDKGMELG